MLTKEELRCFLAIIMLSGYNKLPSYRHYWEDKQDTYHPLVAAAMTRNRFQQILRLLHFCDNSTFNPVETTDKCWKITPIITEFQGRFQQFAPPSAVCSVDESMVKYFGKFGQRIKQHMPSKPIRFGYKI